MRLFTDELHANDQHFVTIVDPGIKEEVGLVLELALGVRVKDQGLRVRGQGQGEGCG
jgi:hypothetical protein